MRTIGIDCRGGLITNDVGHGSTPIACYFVTWFSKVERTYIILLLSRINGRVPIVTVKCGKPQ